MRAAGTGGRHEAGPYRVYNHFMAWLWGELWHICSFFGKVGAVTRGQWAVIRAGELAWKGGGDQAGDRFLM